MMNRYINIAHTAQSVAANARRSIAGRAKAGVVAREPAGWQASAVSAYEHAQRQALTLLPELLAARVAALTGRVLEPESIFFDPDTEIATAVVDGSVFRAHDGQVFLLRFCVDCGGKHFESAPLATRADLGYALSAWKPLCANCPPEDPANWLES
jgi:hypothetical protein